jgi:C-terminal processing protease CtpA/Prc
MSNHSSSAWAYAPILAVAVGCHPTESTVPVRPVASTQGGAKPTAPPPPHRELLVAEQDCTSPPASTVSQHDVAADLAIVEHVLRTGYAGYEAVAAQGHDWEEIFAAARSRLPTLGSPIPVEDFRAFLLDAFGVARDGHLAFWTVGRDETWRWGSTGVHEDAYVSSTPVERKAGKTYLDGDEVLGCREGDIDPFLRPSFKDGPSALLVRMAASQPKPIACRVQSARGEAVRTLGFRPLRLRQPIEDKDARPFLESNEEVPILRLASFDSGQHEALQDFVDAGARLRDEPAIVVDLRGNPGGSDNYARDFFVNLTSGTLRYNTIEKLNSPTTWQGAANWATCSLARSDLDAAGRNEFEQMRGEYLAHLDTAPPGRKTWTLYRPQHEGKAPVPYAGSVVVLVDRRCASSCESFVMYARQLPNTLIVGENTAGVGVFGQVRSYRLPHSGIWMQAGGKWFHDPDPKKMAQEGHGYEPDIWLDTEDPLAAAKNIVRCLKTKRCAESLRAEIHAEATVKAPNAGNPRARLVVANGVAAQRVEQVNHAFLTSYEHLLRLTGVKPTPITLRIYATRQPFVDDLQRYSGFEDTRGFSVSGAPRPLDGQFYVPPDLSPETVCHELTHAFLDTIWGNGYKQAKWLDEGFAQYFAYRYCHDLEGGRVVPLDPDYWRSPVEPAHRLSEMTTEAQWGELRQKNASAVYTQAELTVRWLVDKYGEEKVLAVVRAVESRGLDGALSDTLGLEVRAVDAGVSEVYAERSR